VARHPKKRSAAQSAKDLPWEEAIQRALAEADGALHYADIAERIVSGGLRKSVGATPAATVAAYLSNSLREKSSPYLRVGRGQYTLRAIAEKNTRDQVKTATRTDEAEETGALRAFGMFWRRDFVSWTGPPNLLGKQGAGATDVSFADQVGVYLLHDRERVIYVGRAIDTLFARLKIHTTDRLGGRWDRFSWFGLRSVEASGELSDANVPWSQDVVIETMEAVLIESLEPPLNRRRGDNLSGIEYTQVTDPQIEANKKKAIIDELRKGAGL
jgi:HB1, ASXL, restriction endonuclease HTH domain